MVKLSTPEAIWINGAVRPWGEARVHLWSEVVLRAASVFEGLRGYWIPQESRHYFVHVDAHARRLADSAKLTRIPTDITADDIVRALGELLPALGYREDVYARPTLFLESGRYTASMLPSDSGFFMPVFQSPREPTIDAGIRCQISSWRRSSDETAPPRVKAAANYYNLRLARLEAEAHGYDEAILLNQSGKVAETAGASVFVVRGERIITPKVSDSILESITRNTAIDLLEAGGRSVDVREVDRTELYVADEVFLTGTLCEITPVTHIDGLTIGDGGPGPMTTALQSTYYLACRSGQTDARGWLTAGPVITEAVAR